MKAEFDFITQTSVPSIEFEVCRDIDKFKSILRQKLGKKEATETSWIQSIKNVFVSNEEQKEKPEKIGDKNSKKKDKNKKYGQAESDSDIERAKKESER